MTPTEGDAAAHSRPEVDVGSPEQRIGGRGPSQVGDGAVQGMRSTRGRGWLGRCHDRVAVKITLVKIEKTRWARRGSGEAVGPAELEASMHDPYRQLSRVFHLVGRGPVVG